SIALAAIACMELGVRVPFLAGMSVLVAVIVFGSLSGVRAVPILAGVSVLVAVIVFGFVPGVRAVPFLDGVSVLVAVIVFSVLSMTIFALLFFSVSVLHFRDMQAAAGRKGQVEQLVALPQLLDRISDRSTLGGSDGFVLEADDIAGR
ncbi:MAG: hypothetical protein OXN90_08405, partial [Gemmatimonadota bacterium]|nr:hypothetical protein [Gemmatimonadota bacterium]